MTIQKWPTKEHYRKWEQRQIEIEYWMSLCTIHGIGEDDPRQERLYQEWLQLEYLSNQ